MNQNCINCDTDAPALRSKAELGAIIVVVITLVDMAAEIIFGVLTGSMALLADGIHMGTHALALFITIIAYAVARKHKHNPSFSFGTGKVGTLGGYTNAILLGITAFFMVYESVERILEPVAISFNEAIFVAVLGLFINAICALILQKSGSGHNHSHQHGHAHEHSHEHSKKCNHDHSHDHAHDHAHNHSHDHNHARAHGAGGDANLKAAFMHVLADALTSVLAIAALFAGKYFNWVFLDPLVGLLGAALVLRWAAGLLKETGSLLLDAGDYQGEIGKIRERLQKEGSEIQDIHIWRYSEKDRSLVLRVRDPQKRAPEVIRSYLDGSGPFAHITIEVTG